MRQSEFKWLSPSFFNSHIEAQISSVCLSHAANRQRTVEFLDAIRSGVISLDPDAMTDRVVSKLRVLGVSEADIPTRGACPVGELLYPNLKKSFLGAKLSSQIASAYRDRNSNPGKRADFIRALEDGFIEVHDAPDITRANLRKLAEIGYVGSPIKKAISVG